jgi:hypothetical protein
MPGPCQVRESDRCLHGGGPPRCPGIVNAADGTSCSDASICTTADVCTDGACGGTPVQCASATDTCEPPSGCATDCGPLGCTVRPGHGMLTVPPGALAAPVRITIVFQGSDPGDPSVFQVYSLNPHPTQFATPATLDLPAPPLAPGQIAVIDLNDGTGWVEIPTTLNAGRVTGPISHFSSCRSRAKAPDLTQDLDMFDMVEFQDVVNILNPNGLIYPPGCVPGVSCCEPGSSLFGICFTVENPRAHHHHDATVRIFPACGNGNHSLYVDPVSGAYEGEHCLSTSLLIPCGFVDVDVPLPALGLAPGQQATVMYNFEGSPVHSCLGSSFVGVDVTLREPDSGDMAAGMRSAKDGPFVDVFGNLFQGIYPRDPQDNSKVNGNGRRIKNFLIDSRQ